MTPELKVIRLARRLIEKGWTRGNNARRRNGHKVMSNHPKAARFCARGAISRACYDLKSNVSYWAVYTALVDEVRCDLAVFNDMQLSKKPVIAVFKRVEKHFK
jgi:hypothetical protein